MVVLGTAAYVALIILLVMWGGIGRVDAATPDVSRNQPHRTLPLCLSDEGESAFPCVWVAPLMGNHKGHSFRIYRDGRVKLISDPRAFELAGDCDSNGPFYC